MKKVEKLLFVNVAVLELFENSTWLVLHGFTVCYLKSLIYLLILFQFFRALFFRSITELQFMGFIKSTTRKVDHVIKLTNGSNLLAL